MKTGITIFSTMATIGWVAVATGHTHHLFFTAVPSTVLALGAIVEYRKKKRSVKNNHRYGNQYNR